MENLTNIYCINVRSSTDRRKRMVNRFETSGILDKVTFIDAIPSNSGLIDYYAGYTSNEKEKDKIKRNVISCKASHIKAIRQFLSDAPSIYFEGENENIVNNYGIICEDDIMLSNDFLRRYEETIQNLPDNTPLICLSYLIWQYGDIKWSGKDRNIENICNIGKDVWGTQMYMISREYAIKVINKYDKDNHTLQSENSGHILTSELITRKSGGYIAYPPLAIEDCIFSSIAYVDHTRSNHIQALKSFGYENYNKGELDESSPLSNK
uniref:Glycosyltransferase family 25 n=1 Tax=Pithovirus LCPAC101 TaxID=2506586 RepID=A0A481Z4I8_9VIRU|nr:MAG: glycosyltransferase family 25 [Pithovirus LCPAC101]